VHELMIEFHRSKAFKAVVRNFLVVEFARSDPAGRDCGQRRSNAAPAEPGKRHWKERRMLGYFAMR